MKLLALLLKKFLTLQPIVATNVLLIITSILTEDHSIKFLVNYSYLIMLQLDSTIYFCSLLCLLIQVGTAV